MSGHLVRRLVDWLNRQPVDLDRLDGVHNRPGAVALDPAQDPVVDQPVVESQKSHWFSLR